VVQIHPDPPFIALLELISSLTCKRMQTKLIQPEQKLVLPEPKPKFIGAIAQLGERLPCTQEVSGSIPLSSTTLSICK
tara:strand:+ start:119 stop:352 length:234 start_codon:yes stop_codon:yes gene_type:complete